MLIVLYVGSQLGSTLIATATADPNQRRLMLLLPVVFVVILYRYPAGLLVYWITTNLWTIGQQYLIKRHTWDRTGGAGQRGPPDGTGGGRGGSPTRKTEPPRDGAPKARARASRRVGSGTPRRRSPPAAAAQEEETVG